MEKLKSLVETINKQNFFEDVNFLSKKSFDNLEDLSKFLVREDLHGEEVTFTIDFFETEITKTIPNFEYLIISKMKQQVVEKIIDRLILRYENDLDSHFRILKYNKYDLTLLITYKSYGIFKSLGILNFDDKQVFKIKHLHVLKSIFFLVEKQSLQYHFSVNTDDSGMSKLRCSYYFEPKKEEALHDYG